MAGHGQTAVFVRLTLALLVVLGIAWAGSEWLRVLVERRIQTTRASATVAAIRGRVQQELGGFVGDLFVAARTVTLTYGPGANPKALAGHFAILLEEKPHIDQVRLLSPEGRELVRVVRAPDTGEAVEAPLQPKGDRYYFRHARALPPGSVYLSPLDLNVEQGVIERPHRPVLRLATPLPLGPQGEPAVVVLNMNAAPILAHFGVNRGDGRQLSLLNARGYWLAGGSEHDRFGFMFGRDTTFGTSEPDVWTRVRAGGAHAFIAGDTTYSFETIDVARELADSAHPVHTNDVWYALVTQPAPSPFLWTTARLGLLAQFVVVALLIAWLWSQTVVANRAAQAERARAEAQLVRSERMASLGSLVAGVAHELNTPVGNAVTIASALGDQARAIEAEMRSGSLRKSSIVDFVERTRSGSGFVLRNLERASALIGNFKGIAVDQANEQRRRFALDDYLQEIAAMLEPQLKHRPIAFRLVAETGLTVDSYPGALAQVVTNLVANSLLHGFDEDQAGRISLHAVRTTAGGARIVVEDTGKGMAPDVLAHVFDPFFTTRFGEGGSGLGLSIVHGIVCNLLGGEVHVASEPGRFTRIEVTIPASAPDKEVPHAEAHSA